MKLLSQYINEQLSDLVAQRKDITIQRLAYLKYAMEEDSKDKDLKKIYDSLYSLIFADDGHIRTNKELIDYIKQTMKDNSGNIPGLPKNSVIETIDKKINALDELDPKKLQNCIKEVEKEISDSKSESSKEKNKISLKSDISDKELMEEISQLVDTEGLSNILGLEKNRKMSEEDKNKIKQKEDPIGKEEPEDTEKENSNSEEKTNGNGEENADDELSKQVKNMSDEDLEDLEDLTEDDLKDADELSTEEDEKKEKNESFVSLYNYMVFEESVELTSKGQIKALRKSVNKLSNRDVLSAFLRDNPGSLISAAVGRKRSKEQLAMLQKRIDDASDGEEKEKLQRQRETLKLTSFNSKGKYIGDPLSRKAREKQLIKDGKISKDDILSKEDRKQLRLDAKAFANTDEGKKYIIDSNSELKKKKEEIEREDEKIDVMKKDIEKQKEKEFQEEFDKEKKQKEKEDKKKREAEYQEWKKKKLSEQEPEKEQEKPEDSQQDETVKSDDGSEIIKRKKENSDGYTYVRKKNGKEIGYATEDEFLKVKKK